MDTVKINRKDTKMIAHRGVSGLECENTMAAFIAAANRSYYGIESDVHVTADGKFVMHHDDDTGRLFTKDIRIEEASLEEVLSLRVKANPKTDPENFRRDLVTPTADDYIDICKRYGKKAILEIKNDFTAEKVRELIALIDKYDYLDNTVFISFSWENLIKVRTFRPHQNVQFLTGTCDKALTQKLIEKNIGLDILFTGLNAEIVRKLHAKNIPINCWTVNSAEDAERLISLGVDYITTNILE